MKKIWKKAITVYLIIFPNLLYAQVKNKLILSNNDSLQKRIDYLVFPNVDLGSHINGLGLNLIVGEKIPVSANSNINVRSLSGIRYYLTYLGIPGKSTAFNQQFEISFGFGEFSHVPTYKYPRQNHHTISYYLIDYYSTDKTSQLSGGLKYRNFNSKRELNIVFEDDFFAFEQLDQYRTSAMEFNCKKTKNKKLYGIGTELIFWTGTTTGLGFLHRDQVYNLTNQYGGAYSNGIAGLIFYCNNLRLSIGYDSEKIRSFFQDNFHYLIDDGKIPAVHRQDRVFLRLSLLDIESLY